MAAMSEEIRTRFKDALHEHNFGKRCHAFADVGKVLKASGLEPAALKALLDSLSDGAVFTDKALLIVAKAAGCTEYAKKLLTHPSRSVRFAAARGGLLCAADAREAFLSSGSSRSLKRLLVGYDALPSDKEVLDHAWQLFGAHDKELFWLLLTRVKDEALLRSWLLDGGREEMIEWLGEKINTANERSPVGIAQLANRFPHTMVDLVKKGTLKWAWYWTKDVLSADPALVLRTTFLEGHRRGSGPRKGYDPRNQHQNISFTLASWGWRHQPEVMLDICQERAEKKASSSESSAQIFQHDHDTLMVEMAGWLMEVNSTSYYLTTGQKLKYLMSIWSHIPVAGKTASAAQRFVELLPAGIHQNRTKDLQQLVETFWKIVSELGRATRKEILVGKDSQPCCTAFLQTFLGKLPVPLAVENFFRMLEEFEADSPAYEFVQSNVCASKDGKYDHLMQSVFQRYLQKEGLSASQAASMFQVLLRDARLMDVIQRSFDMLIQRLDEKMELGLMQRVVSRMQELELQSREDPETAKVRIPAATLPVPVEWLRLVTMPHASAPHADFLFHVLNTDRNSSTELLGSMLGKYGPSFFWDCLGHVLQAARTGAKLLEAAPPPNMELFKHIELKGMFKPTMEQSKPDITQQMEAVRKHFSTVAEVKKKTIGKDPAQRQAGYTELMKLAQKERDPSKAFEDLLPFLVGRFGGEQDNVRVAILTDMLHKKLLPFKLWEDMLPQLQSLWKICLKSRESGLFVPIWRNAGLLLVQQALRAWTDNVEPTKACVFGMEIAGELDLPEIYVKLQKEAKEGKEGKDLSMAAASFVFKTAVPLASDTGTPVASFWATLKKMARNVPAGKGAERALWEAWPFVAERWRELLAQGVKQKAIKFVLIGIVDILTQNADSLAVKDDEGKTIKRWWEPVECAEYKDLVNKILEQMQTGEIPPREASSMLALRVAALVKLAQKDGSTWKAQSRKRRERVEERDAEVDMHAVNWMQKELWDIPKHHVYHPLPWVTYRCVDSVAESEVTVLSCLLKNGRAIRQVLWKIAEVASHLSGPKVTALVGEAVATIEPRLEGMARSIARHYPYWNAALTKDEKPEGSCDVLTPLLELWLFDDSSRDDCIGTIMKRDDCEYFLFFGTSFSRHLSNVRQEWLHMCLEKLTPPGAGEPEFYHYARRGPMLNQVAQLGSASPGWRKTLLGVKPNVPKPQATRAALMARLRTLRGGVKKAAFRRVQAQDHAASTTANDARIGSVQMYLWHPDTQGEFLEKALSTTATTTLALIPRLEYMDCFPRVNELLAGYPKEQSAKADSDPWGWEVIQASGAYSDIKLEIERRFSELAPPCVEDTFNDPQRDCLLSALGRADDAGKALEILGHFAGKVRMGKESVTKLISQVRPQHARQLILDMMLPRKSGVGLQVAGLRQIVDLQIPEPLELYQKAWSNGKCPRDVAGIILAKVNTSQSFSPEDVRGFFNFFSEMAGQQDECIYVAGLLLDQLIESPNWSLPFLPDVVAKLAMLPGMTQKAVDALKNSTSHVTEVIKALTEILVGARIAGRALPQVRKDSPETQTLKDLSTLISFASLRDLCRSVSLLNLNKCQPSVLQSLVAEVFTRWEDAARVQDTNMDSLLECILAIWVQLLRVGETSKWMGVLENMLSRLARRVPGLDGPGKASTVSRRGSSRPQNLQILAQVVTNHVVKGMGGTEAALATAGDFFTRILDSHLCDQPELNENTGEVVFQPTPEQAKVAEVILLKCWAPLLALGCPETESSRLFAKCPLKLRMRLGEAIIQKAVSKHADEQKSSMAQWRQKRPDAGWRRSEGIPVEKVVVGSKVDGVVTNSSAQHGVFFNFGCVKDGKLNVPAADWKKYQVGHEVKGMMVNKVDIKENNQFIELILMQEGGSESGHGKFKARDVAQRTVKWMCTPAKMRDVHFTKLAELWASVVAIDSSGSGFEDSLRLLGAPPPPSTGCVRLALELFRCKPAKELIRKALTWLGQVSPEDAIQLWPELLKSSAEKKDVEALLSLCEANNLKPPEFPPLVARNLSNPILDVLAASTIPEARLIVVQVLGEQHCKLEDLPKSLEQLCKDPCEVVKVAARNLWVSLTEPTETGMKEGEKEEGSDENSDEEDEEEDDDDEEEEEED